MEDSALKSPRSSVHESADAFDVSNLEEEGRLMISTIQGLVNRSGPKLYLTCEKGSGVHEWPESRKKWMEWYSQEKGFRFTKIRTLKELLQKYENELKGLVTYDSKNSATRAVAITMSGLEDLVAVETSLLSQMGETLAIKQDLRERWQEDEKLMVYDWALKNLMPKCTKKMAWSLGTRLGVDYAVMKKSFVYDLSPYDEEGKMIDKIISKLNPPAAIWGWYKGEPGRHPLKHEIVYVEHASRYGHYAVCTEGLSAPSFTFHAQVKPESRSFKQSRHFSEEDVTVEKKNYLAFISSEGDTAKILQSYMGGHWMDKNRGSIPINWAIPTEPILEMPAIAEYYYKNATPNDYFVGHLAGGYAFLKDVPDMAQFGSHVNRCMKISDLRYNDFIRDEHDSIERLNQFVKFTPAILGLTVGDGKLGFELLSNNTPIIHHLGYWRGTTPDEISERIKKTVENLEPPVFLIVYFCYSLGGSLVNPPKERKIPTFLKNVVDLLDKDLFQAVRIDEMMALATKSYKNKI